MKRRKMSRKSSNRVFRTTVSRTNLLNLKPRPMRGGFRI